MGVEDASTVLVVKTGGGEAMRGVKVALPSPARMSKLDLKTQSRERSMLSSVAWPSLWGTGERNCGAMLATRCIELDGERPRRRRGGKLLAGAAPGSGAGDCVRMLRLGVGIWCN